MSQRSKVIKYPVPIVSAIIERIHQGQTEILLQTRWKPGKDPKYSGALELPAGTLKMGESVYDALQREVFEETGLRVTGFRPDIHTKSYSQKGDDSIAFLPFCCQQQTQELGRVGFVFVCTVDAGEPKAAPKETRDPCWITKVELRRLLKHQPERFFTFHLGALHFYINYKES